MKLLTFRYSRLKFNIKGLRSLKWLKEGIEGYEEKGRR